MDFWKGMVGGIIVIALGSLVGLCVVWIGAEMFPDGPTPLEECSTACASSGIKSFNLQLSGRADTCECYPIHVVGVVE